MATRAGPRKGQLPESGWLFYDGAWRPVAVLSEDSEHILTVRKTGGEVVKVGFLGFLWDRPTSPSMPVAED
jgi:hypothetical protein